MGRWDFGRLAKECLKAGCGTCLRWSGRYQVDTKRDRKHIKVEVDRFDEWRILGRTSTSLPPYTLCLWIWTNRGLGGYITNGSGFKRWQVRGCRQDVSLNAAGPDSNNANKGWENWSASWCCKICTISQALTNSIPTAGKSMKILAVTRKCYTPYTHMSCMLRLFVSVYWKC